MTCPRRTALAIAAAACTAAAFTAAMTTPASAQSAAATSADKPAAAAGEYCLDGSGYSLNDEFYRCTGTSQTSAWVGSSCATGNHNAASSYNIYDARNECVGSEGYVRVWLHQYTDYANGNGWAICVNPDAYGQEIDPDYQHPENIQVTTNTEAC
jgi:hypothetical protein